MKIQELLEAAVVPYTKEEMAKEKAISILEGSEFFHNNKNTPLWRGSKTNSAEFILLDPASGTRQSHNTKNFYTLLLDNSPYYQGWPKRSKSLICSTSMETAYSYSSYGKGSAYAVIPLNGAKIGVCPKNDIWWTPVNIFDNVNYDVFAEITGLMQSLGFSDVSYQSMLKTANDEALQKSIKHHIGDRNLIEYLHEQMSPEKTGMKLETASSISPGNLRNRECWTDGKCLLIRSDIYKKLPGVNIEQ